MGLSVTENLLSQGDIVIAAVRNPASMKAHQEKYGADQLLVVKVNVQSQEDVDAAFSKARETFGRIDVIYNNAGYSAVGEVEAMPMEDAKDMFEVGWAIYCIFASCSLTSLQTNFFGATRISLASIKFFREVNDPIGGRLILASSIYGIVVSSFLDFE
jgi:NAD(P)-dependent dehydrogenase (short-subunit alcohol dehydrogenase family)